MIHLTSFVYLFVASDSYNNSSEGLRGYVFEPIRAYLDDARIKANLTPKNCNTMCGNQMAGHYFTKTQWVLPTKTNYNKLRAHMDLKPYEEIKQEYEQLRKEYEPLRRTFNLTEDRPYNNTWNFKAPTSGGRHPCE